MRDAIALVSCSKEKREGTHLARDLYTSQLFRSALAHCEANYEHVYVLSAKHGLVQLTDAIRSYDVTLADYDDEGRAWWAHLVMGQVSRWHVPKVGGDPLKLHVFAGAFYAEPLKWQLPEFPGWTITEPMAGLQVGQRLAWFKERRAA